MNKYIKKKKSDKLRRNSFTKEDLLFIKQFPKLFPTCNCMFSNITRIHIKKVYNKAMKYSRLDKDEFETSMKMILIVLHEHNRIGIRVRYYLDLYTKLGIMFKDEQGNIKLNSI